MESRWNYGVHVESIWNLWGSVKYSKYVTYMWGLIFPFFWEWKFCHYCGSTGNVCCQGSQPPHQHHGPHFYLYRVLHCRLNELFTSELCKKFSCGHTLLFVLLPDDGPTWSKGRFSSRITFSLSGLGECGLSSSSASTIAGVVHFRFFIPDPQLVIGRVFEGRTDASWQLSMSEKVSKNIGNTPLHSKLLQCQ